MSADLFLFLDYACCDSGCEKSQRHAAGRLKNKTAVFLNFASWALGWVGGYFGPRQRLRQVKEARREAPKKKKLPLFDFASWALG